MSEANNSLDNPPDSDPNMEITNNDSESNSNYDNVTIEEIPNVSTEMDTTNVPDCEIISPNKDTNDIAPQAKKQKRSNKPYDGIALVPVGLQQLKKNFDLENELIAIKRADIETEEGFNVLRTMRARTSSTIQQITQTRGIELDESWRIFTLDYVTLYSSINDKFSDYILNIVHPAVKKMKLDSHRRNLTSRSPNLSPTKQQSTTRQSTDNFSRPPQVREESSAAFPALPAVPISTATPPAAAVTNSSATPSTAASQSNNLKANYARKDRMNKVPPIFIDDVKNGNSIMSAINKISKDSKCSIKTDKMMISAPSIEDYRKISDYVKENKLPGYAFRTEEKKTIHAVIRGLPGDINVNELHEELIEAGYPVKQVSQMKNRRNNTNMPLFLCTLVDKTETSTKTIDDFDRLNSIHHFIVNVEPLRKKKTPAQCFRCQGFFHHSDFCFRQPKCLKCAGPHLTNTCPKSRDTPAICANCQGAHPANFLGCPANPQNRSARSPNQFPSQVGNAWRRPPTVTPPSQAPTTSMPHTSAPQPNANQLATLMSNMTQMMNNFGLLLANFASSNPDALTRPPNV